MVHLIVKDRDQSAGLESSGRETREILCGLPKDETIKANLLAHSDTHYYLIPCSGIHHNLLPRFDTHHSLLPVSDTHSDLPSGSETPLPTTRY